jgi:hypothetical protein
VSEVAKGLTVTYDMGWCLICHFAQPAGRGWVFDCVLKVVMSIAISSELSGLRRQRNFVGAVIRNNILVFRYSVRLSHFLFHF